MYLKSVALCSFMIMMMASPVLSRAPIAPAGKDEKKNLEEKVLGLEEAGRQKILKGDGNWDDLIAEDAYMIGFDGSIIIYKKGFQFPSFPVKEFKLSEMIARSYGEAVVVTGLAEVEGETADKKPYSFKMRFINVWKKSGGSWKIVVSERTGVRPPPKTTS